MALLELKRVVPEQLSAVLELDQLCFGGLWTLEGYQRELDSPNSEILGLSIYKDKHEISKSFSTSPVPLLGIGCLWAIVEEAHLTILAVHPHYQRQGLGQALLIALLMVAKRRGLERATLEVRASNQPALSLYQKFGFKTAGRRRRYYQDTGEDALILWRGGLQHAEFAQTLADWERLLLARLEAAGWNLEVNLNLLPLEDSSLRID